MFQHDRAVKTKKPHRYYFEMLGHRLFTLQKLEYIVLAAASSQLRLGQIISGGLIST